MSIRDRIELYLEAWGHWAYRHSTCALLGVALVLAVIVPNVRFIRIDTATESFLHDGDPVRAAYQEFREEFGMDERILVAVKGEAVFERGFIDKLRSLHDELSEGVPSILAVDSLLNARETRGVADELVVEDFFEIWPENEAALAALRDRALSNPLYRDMLVSSDGQLTVLMLEPDTYTSVGLDDALSGFDEPADAAGVAPPAFLTGDEMMLAVEAVHTIAARYDAPGFRVYAAGSPVLSHKLQTSMSSSMRRFTLVGVATIALFLGLLFRRVVGVVLPLLVSVLSLAGTFGIVGLLGTPLSLMATILPSFLLAVGVGGSVHILVIVQQHLARGASKEDAVAYALKHSGLPVIMTNLTTAAGLASFATTSMLPAAQLGLLGPIGVMISLALTLTLGPALIAKLPLRADEQDPRTTRSARFLTRIGAWSVARAGFVATCASGLLVAAVLGALTLSFSHDPVKWFSEDDEFRVASDVLNEHLKGSVFLEIVIDTGVENGLYDPELLQNMEALRVQFSRMQEGDLFVGKSLSLADIVKEIHQALNANDPVYRAIPGDRALIAQELLLFENSGADDLDDFVDSQFSKGRMTLKMPFVDALAYASFIDRVHVQLRETLGEDASFSTSGIMELLGRIFDTLMETLVRSYLLAFVLIIPLMIALLGNLRLGLIAMIPNFMPIVLALGLMGWLGVPLEMFTLLTGSIALGLAVDDTIHFMHNFRREYERGGDVAAAVSETLQTTGQALLFTSVVLSCGFFTYMLSDMANLVTFGWITGFTIIAAFLSDLVLAPALVALLAPRPPRVESGEA